MNRVKTNLLVAILLCCFCVTSYGQGPLRRLGCAIVEHRPVRTAVNTIVERQPVRSTVKAVVQAQPVRSVLKGTYQAVTQNRSYGSTGYNTVVSNQSYGSTGYTTVTQNTSYGGTGYNVVTQNRSYGSYGTVVSNQSYPVVTSITTVECKDCKTKGTEPPSVGSSEPIEYSGAEASNNFHRSVVTAIEEARKEGKISRINALALRGALHLPSFQAKVKETVIAKAKETGQISVSATPEEVGKIDFSKIDWIGLIKALLPIILTFL